MRNKYFPFVWLSVAVLLGYSSCQGGVVAISYAIYFFLWALPFSILWYFLLNSDQLSHLPPDLVLYAAVILSIALSFCFWFLFVPFLKAKGNPSVKPGREK